MGRVAPLYDAAGRLDVFELANDLHQPARIVELPLALPRRVAVMHDQRVTCVICGAVSDYALRTMNGAGIEVVPWVCGPVEQIRDAYLADRLAEPVWAMPGCWRRRFGRGRGRRGFGPQGGQR